jgi:predicted subunit of tRNA(5-methylaminomethyl-2-thiouridylate) methyltransferase
MDNNDNVVALLFSGGRDSSLACAMLAKKGYKIHLLTFNNGTIINLDLAEQRFNELEKRFSGTIIAREVIPSYGLFKEIALIPIEKDFKKYETNLLCMGCKLAMHVLSLIYCLENKIQIIADGYTEYQRTWIEQMPEAIHAVRKFHEEYKVKYVNPVYDQNSKEQVKKKLFSLGLSTKSLEGSCLFGGTFSIPPPEKVVAYIEEKLPLCRNYIKTHFNEKDKKLIEAG